MKEKKGGIPEPSPGKNKSMVSLIERNVERRREEKRRERIGSVYRDEEGSSRRGAGASERSTKYGIDSK